MNDFGASIKALVKRQVQRELKVAYRELKKEFTANGRDAAHVAEKLAKEIEKATDDLRPKATSNKLAKEIEKATDDFQPKATVKKSGKPSLARRRQGAYMAAVRSLAVKDKAAVKKVKEEQGIVAATKFAKDLTAGA